ncbi:hypothetical protein HYH03_010018 [Edaphochlamys debaryana]|uniref:General transcription factor 3C polypeptide 3 n=1 Tax=Edaphochlamys debaryana TaxID=47281 RepID=A0A835XZ22_9CHLO|nr:hypothetical protein HYH03_010018 [Edaphochlamys debaryana]|eukprot:KAG2491648.1 hypothetical protein HYH03_010018 [Edaphochlamys debaryana]
MADAEPPSGEGPGEGAGPSSANPTPANRPTRSAANRGASSSKVDLSEYFSSESESESGTDEGGDEDWTTAGESVSSLEEEEEEDGEGLLDSEGGGGSDGGGGGRGRGRGRGRRGRPPGSGRARGSRSPPGDSSGDGGYSSGGYTSGFTTGDDSDYELFGDDMGPMALLQALEQHAAGLGGVGGGAGGGGPGGGGGEAARQPFELLRERRKKLRAGRAGRGGSSEEDEEAELEDEEAEDDAAAGGATSEGGGDAGAGPSSSGPPAADAPAGRGRGRGRRGRPPLNRDGSEGGAGRGRGRRGRPPLNRDGAGAAMPTGRGRGRPRGRGRGRAASGLSADVFGEGVDVDAILNDPLAEKVGLVEPKRGRSRYRYRKKAGRRKRGVPEEVVQKMGEANMMYASGQYEQAIQLLTEVIKEHPNTADPYHTLGLLYEAMGNQRKSLDFFMIAAHLSPKDVALWKRLALMSTNLGFYRQAIYCLTKAIARNKADLDAVWDRAVLFAQVGDHDRALAQFALVAKHRPGDPEVPIMLARLHHHRSEPLKAIQVLEAHVRDHPTAVNLTQINILAELYMDRGGYEEAHSLIQRTAPVLCGDSALPLDLAVKAGLCLAHMGRWDAADEVLQELLAEAVEAYGDLYSAVGQALAGLGRHERALAYLTPLLEHPDFNEPGLWRALLVCHRGLGEAAQGQELYRTQLAAMGAADPRYASAVLTLAEECLVELRAGQAAAAAAPSAAAKRQALELLEGLEGFLKDGPEEPPPPAEAEAAATAEAEAGPAEAEAEAAAADAGPAAAAAEAGAADVEMAEAGPAATAPAAEATAAMETEGAATAAAAAAGPSEAGTDAATAAAAEAGAAAAADADLEADAAKAKAAALAALGRAAAVLGEEGALRLSELYQRLGQMDRFVAVIRPAVEASMAATEADLARVNDPSLPAELRKAIQRHRMFARRGGRKGQGASEVGSVFKGQMRRDRRKAHIREADRQAAEFLGLPAPGHAAEGGETSGTEGGGSGGDTSGGESSGGEGLGMGGMRRRRRGKGPMRLPQGGLVGRNVLSSVEQCDNLMILVRAMVAAGQIEEAKALLERSLAMATAGNAAADRRRRSGQQLRKKDVAPWFDRRVVDRLRSAQLELAQLSGDSQAILTLGLGLRADGTDGARGGGRRRRRGLGEAGPTVAEDLAAAGEAAAAAAQGRIGPGHLAAVRALTARWPHSIGLWSLFCAAHAQGTDLRSWGAHIGNLRRKNPASVPLMVLQGHVYLLSRHFDAAASEYFHAFRFAPGEPLLLLCLGVALLSAAMAQTIAGGHGAGGGAAPGPSATAWSGAPPNRAMAGAGAAGRAAGGVRDRNRGILEAFAFLQAYQQTRGSALSQEAAYNLGRAAHQLGLTHIAHHYYEAALAAPPPAPPSAADGASAGPYGAPAGPWAGSGLASWASGPAAAAERTWDLRREAAHNLVALYKSSGATALAREVMMKYLVV